MATQQLSPVLIRTNDERQTSGQLQTTYFAPPDRVRRGLARLGLFWLLSAASLPIIFAHWVLVPGFFIAGPWMGYHAYQITRRRDHVKGPCPACNQEVTIKLEADDELPKWTYCPACNAPLQISAQD